MTKSSGVNNLDGTVRVHTRELQELADDGSFDYKSPPEAENPFRPPGGAHKSAARDVHRCTTASAQKAERERSPAPANRVAVLNGMASNQ
eukprot:CAMPEP_0179268522 /NCGR_PEP_ID=MMETSP0797-20121207/30485_1 /TAXON_ID=47934 /ORGANISM="Dinophysis acuminata, Strain DAEP01" /LENGTH=89 /DNA_ID=CAMNT_0020976809 /DNA_START=35 /DNA_END=304 /DNA_ORIENTATION=+